MKARAHDRPDPQAELIEWAEQVCGAAARVLAIIDRQGGITKHAQAVERLREVLEQPFRESAV
jgi:hypothetical protein